MKYLRGEFGNNSRNQIVEPPSDRLGSVCEIEHWDDLSLLEIVYKQKAKNILFKKDYSAGSV